MYDQAWHLYVMMLQYVYKKGQWPKPFSELCSKWDSENGYLMSTLRVICFWQSAFHHAFYCYQDTHSAPCRWWTCHWQVEGNSFVDPRTLTLNLIWTRVIRPVLDCSVRPTAISSANEGCIIDKYWTNCCSSGLLWINCHIYISAFIPYWITC